MSRHAFLSAALSLSALVACIDTDVEVGAPGADVTAAERAELGKTYDVATGTVEDDTALSLAALRDVADHAPLLGTDGPRFDEAEGAVPANVVIGADTRTRITPTTSFPASANVFLTMTFPDGYVGNCSGSMIRSRYVLTAGHCVFDSDHDGWATSITASGGQNAMLPGPTASVTKMRSVTGWTEDDNNDYDYALLTLAKDIGVTTGVYCLGSFSDDTIDASTGYIYGYPEDKTFGTQWGSGGPIEDHDSTMLYYDIDTAGGMSGSGVYRFHNGARCVFGVHGGDGYYWGEHYNRAARINNARFNLIVSWMDTGV